MPYQLIDDSFLDGSVCEPIHALSAFKGPVLENQIILVVDDNEVNLTLMSAILGRDYQVYTAEGAEEALRLLHEVVRPDLILLDVMMPEVDGYQLAATLKEDPRTLDIPIIFVTAKSDVSDEIRGFQLGAVDYITKPVSPPLVRARVRTHLALASQNRELDRQVREKTSELYDTRLKLIQRLGRAAEYRDNETGNHVIRMSRFSQIIALGLGMSEAVAEMLLHAAPMHDVGKIGIPDAILRKPGPLTPDERKIMETHVLMGAEIIGDDESDLLKTAAMVAKTHHEKWDGSGYPSGLKGEDIPLLGRVVAVADVFDALTSERPYKRAWTVEEAIALMKSETGKHFDPLVMDVFLEKLPEILEVKDAHRD